MLYDSYGRALTAGPGAFDDASADGAIRAHLATGELVKLPFEDGKFLSEVQGSGYNRLQCGGQYALANSDGSGTVLNIAAQDANVHNGGNRVSLAFYGTRFGLRFLCRASNGYSAGLSAEIDGIRYEVRHKADPVYGASTPDAIETLWMCPDTFRDHRHLARIQIPGALNSATQNYYLTGIVVERRPGNGDPILNKRAVPISVGQLTAAFAAVPSNNAFQALAARYIRRIDYCNTDSAGHVVQIEAGSAVIWEAVLAAAGSTGSSASFVPGEGGMVMNAGTDPTYDVYYQHKADAAGKVNFHVAGGA